MPRIFSTSASPRRSSIDKRIEPGIPNENAFCVAACKIVIINILRVSFVKIWASLDVKHRKVNHYGLDSYFSFRLFCNKVKAV